jgi:hypothetical protein
MKYFHYLAFKEIFAHNLLVNYLKDQGKIIIGTK